MRLIYLTLALCASMASALPSQQEMMQTFDLRRLKNVDRAHLQRHLMAMDEASDRENAKAIFNMYKVLDNDNVEKLGDTFEEQFDVFYAKVFPELQEQGQAILDGDNDVSGPSPASGDSDTASGSNGEPSDGNSPSTGDGDTSGTDGENGGTGDNGGNGGNGNDGDIGNSGNDNDGGNGNGGNDNNGNGGGDGNTGNGGGNGNNDYGGGNGNNGNGGGNDNNGNGGVNGNGGNGGGNGGNGGGNGGNGGGNSGNGGNGGNGGGNGGNGGGNGGNGNGGNGGGNSGNGGNGGNGGGNGGNGGGNGGNGNGGGNDNGGGNGGGGSTHYATTDTGKTVEVQDGLSFYSSTYSQSSTSFINNLKSYSRSLESVVVNSRSDGNYRPVMGPKVLSGPGAKTLSRRLEGTNTTSVGMLFCDVSGNALWRLTSEFDVYNAEDYDESGEESVIGEGQCLSTASTLDVSAYQSGCSLQNHPEGCDDVFMRGCSGLGVSADGSTVVVSRQGGRSLGVLSYKEVDGECQGRIVDAITTYRGKKLNGPASSLFSSKGDLYFTDPPFGLANNLEELTEVNNTLDDSPQKELPFNGVYRLPAAGEDSRELELLDCDMERPNKLALSPNETVMYVTNSRRNDAYVKQYELNEDGSVGSSSILFNFSAYPELKTGDGIADGLAVDSDGNLYVAVWKAVFVISPGGELLAALNANQEVRDVAIGEGRIFITGDFGMIAYATGAMPAQTLVETQTTCSS